MNDKLNKIYQYLSSQSIKNLPTSYDEFEVMMQDKDKASKVHSYLLSNKIKNVDQDFNTFSEFVGIKKKEDSIPNLLENVLYAQKNMSVGNKVSETPSVESGTQPQLLQSTEQPQVPQKKDTGSYLGDVFERIGAGALDLITSGGKQARFARKLINIPKDIVKKELGFLGVGDETATKISNAMPFLKPPMIGEGVALSEQVWNKLEKTDEFKAIENKKTELQESSARYDKTIEELFKNKDYKKAIGASFLAASESLPVTLTAMFGGPVGLASLGSYSASTQYDQLSANTDMTEASKIANALVNGGLEIATEKLGSANYGKLIKGLYKTVGKEVAEQTVKSGLKNWFKTMFKRFGLYTAPLGEGLEEFVNQLGGNITARATGEDPERSLRFGLTDATFAGIAGGTQITIMGLPAKVAQSFKPTKEDNAPPKPKEGEKVVEKKVTDMDYSFKGKEITKQDAEQLIDDAKEIDKLDGLKYKDDKVLDSRIRDKFNVQIGPLEVSKEVTEQREAEMPAKGQTKIEEESKDAEGIRDEVKGGSQQAQGMEQGEEVFGKARDIDQSTPSTDVLGNKILSAEEWNKLTPKERENQSTITRPVTDKKGNTFNVDFGLAPFLQRILNLGLTTGQSDSGMKSDHPRHRYISGDKEGEIIEGGTYLTFWKPEATQVKEAGRDINTQEDIDNIRRAAKESGFIAYDGNVFFQPSLGINLPATKDGTWRQDILKEANILTNERHPELGGVDDKHPSGDKFMEWLNLRNSYEDEVVEKHGGEANFTDRQIADMFEKFVSLLEKYKGGAKQTLQNYLDDWAENTLRIKDNLIKEVKEDFDMTLQKLKNMGVIKTDCL